MLECNWLAFEVFTRCEPALVAGMAGAFYTGLPSAEIRAVMSEMSVPAGERLETFDAVKQMGRVWAETRNAARATD